MKLSVVIPSRAQENLDACAASISARESNASLYTVIDGGPLRFYGAGLLGYQPFCFARNVNLGVRAALVNDAEAVILLNDDTRLLTNDGFAALCATALANPDYGPISAAIVGHVGNPRQHPQDGDALREEHDTLAFIAVCLTRATIEKVGLLDEEISGAGGYGFEDNDYCRRAKAASISARESNASLYEAGLKLGIYDGCHVEHGVLPSTFREGPRKYDTSHTNPNARAYYRKWGDLCGLPIPDEWRSEPCGS